MVGLSIWPFSSRLIMARSMPVRSARSDMLSSFSSRRDFESSKGFAQFPIIAHRMNVRDVSALDQRLQTRLLFLKAIANRLLGRFLFRRLNPRAMDSLDWFFRHRSLLH